MSNPLRWPFSLAALLLIALGVVAAIVLLTRGLRRADIDDPDQLAQMPAARLRDGEIETLMRAAFRNAERIEVHWREEGPDGKKSYPTTTVTDRVVLNELADLFDVGWDGQQTNYNSYPGIDYLSVTFDGPYNPSFTFAGEHQIYIFGGSMVEVPSAFGRKLADTVGIEYTIPMPDRRR